MGHETARVSALYVYFITLGLDVGETRLFDSGAAIRDLTGSLFCCRHPSLVVSHLRLRHFDLVKSKGTVQANSAALGWNANQCFVVRCGISLKDEMLVWKHSFRAGEHSCSESCVKFRRVRVIRFTI